MKLKRLLKTDKGASGMGIFLSLIIMTFVVGLLVMVFSLIGSSLKNTTTLNQSETSGATTQVNVQFDDGGTALTACSAKSVGDISSISSVKNYTGAITINSANYTFAGCTLTATATSEYNNTKVNVTYIYTYGGAGWDTVNDTIDAVSGATTYFSIFIVIGAMVVLIALVVLIILAVRGTGYAESGYSGGNGGATA